MDRTADSLRAENEDLLQRVCELQDFQQRVEEQAAEMVGLAENLDVARRQAEAASNKSASAAMRARAVLPKYGCSFSSACSASRR